jgi:hypothetical protein
VDEGLSDEFQKSSEVAGRGDGRAGRSVAQRAAGFLGIFNTWTHVTNQIMHNIDHMHIVRATSRVGIVTFSNIMRFKRHVPPNLRAYIQVPLQLRPPPTGS